MSMDSISQRVATVPPLPKSGSINLRERDAEKIRKNSEALWGRYKDIDESEIRKKYDNSENRDRLIRYENQREWDWRQFGILNSIREQGLGQCCFAFAVCAQIESLFHLPTRGEVRIVLSPQDIYQNMINNEVEDDLGRTIPDTLDWIVENGCVLDEDCPYRETYDVNNDGPRKVNLRIETVIPLRSEEAIIEAVKEEGPVAAQMYWIEKDMKRFKGDGICYTPEDVSKIKEMHAVLIVGFGEYLGRKGKLTKYWIIRNSHGSNWGDRGYGKVERSLVTGAWQVRGIAFEDLNGIPY